MISSSFLFFAFGIQGFQCNSFGYKDSQIVLNIQKRSDKMCPSLSCLQSHQRQDVCRQPLWLPRTSLARRSRAHAFVESGNFPASAIAWSYFAYKINKFLRRSKVFAEKNAISLKYSENTREMQKTHKNNLFPLPPLCFCVSCDFSRFSYKNLK